MCLCVCELYDCVYIMECMDFIYLFYINQVEYLQNNM